MSEVETQLRKELLNSYIRMAIMIQRTESIETGLLALQSHIKQSLEETRKIAINTAQQESARLEKLRDDAVKALAALNKEAAANVRATFES